MSLDWARIKTGLVLFAERARVVDVGRVFWEREAHPITFDNVLLLRISDERAHGFDDVDDLPLPPLGERNAPRITGIREFTVSFRYSSRSQVATAARIGLERLRASFHHPGLLQILYDHGIGFLATETLVTSDMVRHDRWESDALLDARFCAVSELYDPADPDQGVDTLAAVGIDTRAPDPIDPAPRLISE